jgi:hypothetical protein
LMILYCVPALRLTLTNLALFVAGAFPGTFALMIPYSRTFADADRSGWRRHRRSLAEDAYFSSG